MYKNQNNLWVPLLELVLTFFNHGNYHIESLKQARIISQQLMQARIEIRDITDNEKYIEMVMLIDEAQEVLKSKIGDLEKPIVSEEQR